MRIRTAAKQSPKYWMSDLISPLQGFSSGRLKLNGIQALRDGMFAMIHRPHACILRQANQKPGNSRPARNQQVVRWCCLLTNG